MARFAALVITLVGVGAVIGVAATLTRMVSQ